MCPTTRWNGSIRRSAGAPTWSGFPDRSAVVRLVGAVLAEQNDECIEQPRCLGLEVLAKARLRLVADQAGQQEVVTPTAIAA